jgi:ABC-type branched-subunit amino acid transport system substrate-binding protein
MTVGMRIRMWAKRAPRAQVLTTLAVVAAMVAALVVVVVPVRSHSDSLLAGPSERTAASAALAGGGPDGSADSTQTGAAGAGGADTGTAGTGSTGAVVSAGGTPASGTASGARAGTPSTVKAPTGGAPKEALRASDIGVTPTTIKVGFLNVQIAGFDATGFALGFRQDLESVEKALVDWANKNGGVAGRKVTYVTGKADPLSDTSMRAGCTKMADDEKVFVVFDQTATAGPAMNCYPEKHIPAITTNAGTVDSPSWNAARGYLISGGATFDRQALNWATFSLEDGSIGKGKGKLGILSDDCTPDPAVVDKILTPFLRSHGVATTEQRLSCDAGTAQQQVAAAALALRRDGADRVLLLPLFATAQNFVQAAEAQNWLPKYLVMDKSGLTLNATTQGFSPTAFNGARGYTYGHSGEDKAGVPLGAGGKQCSNIMIAAGLPGVTDQMGKDGLAIAACDAFFTWLEAMRHTSVNPTRQAFINGVAAIGDFKLAAFALRAVYGPQRFQGSDSFAGVEWHGDCKCWLQTHRPVAARY